MYCKAEVRVYQNQRGKIMIALFTILLRGKFNDTRIKGET